DCTRILEEFCTVVTYVTQPLNNDAFAFNTYGQAEFLHYIGHAAHFAQAEEYPKTCSFTTTAYTTLSNGFTGYATCSINFARMHGNISIEDPCHLTLAGSVVWSRYIGSRSDEFFLN